MTTLIMVKKSLYVMICEMLVNELYFEGLTRDCISHNIANFDSAAFHLQTSWPWLSGRLSTQYRLQTLSVREIILIGCSAKRISTPKEKGIKKEKAPWACVINIHDFTHLALFLQIFGLLPFASAIFNF